MDAETQKENLKRAKELKDFIAAQSTEITEFDEDLVRRLIDRITIFSDRFTVEFKSGVTVDIKAGAPFIGVPALSLGLGNHRRTTTAGATWLSASDPVHSGRFCLPVSSASSIL